MPISAMKPNDCNRDQVFGGAFCCGVLVLPVANRDTSPRVVASIAVLLICHSALTSMDETYANKDAGYWPKPLDWSAPSKSDESPTAETKS